MLYRGPLCVHSLSVPRAAVRRYSTWRFDAPISYGTVAEVMRLQPSLLAVKEWRSKPFGHVERIGTAAKLQIGCRRGAVNDPVFMRWVMR